MKEAQEPYLEMDVREVPVYSMSEAARYLSLAPATLGSWLKGRYYTAGGIRQWWEPLITLADQDASMLSFNNLVEAHVLKSLRRKHGVPMKGVRIALDYAKKKYSIERLFLSQELHTVKHKKGDRERNAVGALFLKKLGEVEQISAGGQLVLREALTRHLARVDRDSSGMPIRLFPFLGSRPDKQILIDPRVSFGRPVLANRGIRVSTLVERVNANEDIDRIASDYAIDRAEIFRALEFHEQAA